MKKLMMLCLLLSTVAFVQAQTKDSTLQDFVGKYKFPEGSIVTEVVVSMEGEGLVMSSSVGNSILVKTGEDLFSITAYDGTGKKKTDYFTWMKLIINNKGPLALCYLYFIPSNYFR